MVIYFSAWYPGPEDDEPWKAARYATEFFVHIQDMMERAVMEEILGQRVSSPGVYLQEIPYPCYRYDKFSTSLLFFLPIAMLLSWLFPVAMATRALVQEKESRQKEFMKMMGVSGGLLQLSWFLYSMMTLLLSIVGMIILLKAFELLPKTNSFLLFLFLTEFAMATLSYSFFLSAFFNSANLAACISVGLYFIVVFVIAAAVPNMNSISPLAMAACVSG